MGKILAFRGVDLPLSLILYVRVNANFTYDFYVFARPSTLLPKLTSKEPHFQQMGHSLPSPQGFSLKKKNGRVKDEVAHYCARRLGYVAEMH